MSEDNPQVTVTTTKQKDPRRVEAGKRLGQISKQIREQRIMDRIKAEKQNGWDYGYTVGIAGLILAGISVYYARASLLEKNTRETKEPRIPDPETVNIPIKLNAMGSRLDTL